MFSHIERWLFDIFSIRCKFKVCEILLGIIDTSDVILEIINLILIMGKLHIYKSKQSSGPIIFLKFLINLKYYLHALELVYEKENKTGLYIKKYEMLLDNI